MINIAVDAMGGDFAPEELVKGGSLALKEYQDLAITFVGPEEKLRPLLAKYCKGLNFSIKNASEQIGMNESPVSAVREKKDASVNVALSLVKEGLSQGVVSAGNTGAFMAAALFKLGRIDGVERPAIATIFPTEKNPVLLLDMGANVDNKPKHLQQFGQMGSMYATKVMNIQNPKVGLLNIGEEKEKGNELTQASWELLSQANINFIGNVESKEILSGKVDVVVCDGFVGNLVLKLAESISYRIINLLKKEMSKSLISKIGAFLLIPAFKNLKKQIDYDEYGGAQLLGVNGVCVKAHGRATSKAIKNAIRVALESVKGEIVSSINFNEEMEKKNER